MAREQKTSHIGLTVLVCELGLCGSELPFDQTLFASLQGGRGLLARGAEGHGDDDEDDEDDEDEDVETWQVARMGRCR